MTDGKLHLLTCVAVPLAERVEGGFGFAGPVGGAGPTGAGGHRLAQVVGADFLGVVGGCFTPVCNTATANQQADQSTAAPIWTQNKLKGSEMELFYSIFIVNE